MYIANQLCDLASNVMRNDYFTGDALLLKKRLLMVGLTLSVWFLGGCVMLSAQDKDQESSFRSVFVVTGSDSQPSPSITLSLRPGGHLVDMDGHHVDTLSPFFILDKVSETRNEIVVRLYLGDRTWEEERILAYELIEALGIIRNGFVEAGGHHLRVEVHSDTWSKQDGFDIERG